MARSEEQSLYHTAMTLLPESLGFLVSYRKSQLVQAGSTDYLGFKVDSNTLSLNLPELKVAQEGFRGTCVNEKHNWEAISDTSGCAARPTSLQESAEVDTPSNGKRGLRFLDTPFSESRTGPRVVVTQPSQVEQQAATPLSHSLEIETDPSQRA